MIMHFKIFLILLPAVLAEITINISKQEFQVSGESLDVISDAERQTFQITDIKLKDAIEKFTLSRPDDVFVKSRTPYEDLYKRYKWTEVTRTIKVKNASWMARRTVSKEIARKEFYNNGSAPAVYTGHVSETVNNTISQSWDKFVSNIANVNYNINASGNIFKIKKDFGVNGMGAASTELGSQLSYNITLQPGQKASAALMTDACFMMVEVVYEMLLSGSVATHYGRTHKGLPFRAFDINDVMDAGGLPRTVEWREIFNVVYYDNATLVTLDANGRSL